MMLLYHLLPFFAGFSLFSMHESELLAARENGHERKARTLRSVKNLWAVARSHMGCLWSYTGGPGGSPNLQQLITGSDHGVNQAVGLMDRFSWFS